jgi:prevent-host-death family protein
MSEGDGMPRTWQLQDAKNRFSEVVDRALTEGPQTVTRRGREAVVVVSVDDYRRLTGARSSFKELLRRAPLSGVELRRDRDTGRQVDLP